MFKLKLYLIDKYYINNTIIGNMYLIFAYSMFLFAGLLILGVRVELFSPGLNIMLPNYFNSFISVHGLFMIFTVITPFYFGISHWVIPNLIFFKKFKFISISFISLISCFISIINFFIIKILPDNILSIGWTMYPSLSFQLFYNIDLLILSIFFLSLSIILTSINTSVTIIKKFKLNFIKMPIILWSLLISSYLIIISMPVLIGVLLMILLDKYFNTSFFNPLLGGDVILYQHIFWFFGHPEVYILILPAFGLISQIISNFSIKKIFGYRNIIYSLFSISILSLVVWGHHMFLTGIPLIAKLFFMYCTILIVIPTGIKIFNWVLTFWKGNLIFVSPFLFSIGFLYFFFIGGFSGIILSLVPLNIYYHGTYFVVAHFHYILVSAVLFAVFAGFYYWSPLILNIRYDEFKSNVHFWFSFIFFNFVFFPMHFLGFKSMPRRYVDYPLKYVFFNKFITINTIFLSFFQLYFLYKILIFYFFFNVLYI